jgi:hypothetical protein
MNDFEISFEDTNTDESSGTTVPVRYPYGIGLYIASECYREINNPECAKLMSQMKSKSQKSCDKSIIPSAYVIGNGFLITNDAIDKTRRKSLITRLCNKPIK